MHTRKLCFALFCIICLAQLTALASPMDALPEIISAPSVMKPGQAYEITLWSPQADTVTFILIHESLKTAYLAMSDIKVEQGESIFVWDGHLPGNEPIPVGEYLLCVQYENGDRATANTRIGLPRPKLSGVSILDSMADDGELSIQFHANIDGTLDIKLLDIAESTIVADSTMPITSGDHVLRWQGEVDGKRLPNGAYTFLLSLKDSTGEESQQAYAFVDIKSEDVLISQTPETPDFNTLTKQLFSDHASINLSPPYGTRSDSSYWSLPPGETDDQKIWDVLTQPITVYDDGRIGAIGHVYMRENPDGTGKRTAQIHGLSQGLHVIGEVNAYGYVLVEAFSNYDPSFSPLTEEEKAYAFTIRQGYLKAEHLKTIPVQQDIAFLVDKLTQRMYMFIDGVRVTEFTISTGKITNEKYYRETIAGEFITIGFSDGYWDNDLFSAWAIRFNGGTMLHETPHTEDASGARYYGAYDRFLGTKHSAGCVRVPHWENAEGYNQGWIYANLNHRGHYKIIIWDDINRFDSPTVWR